MIDELLSHIAPHHCYGCGIIGQIMCNDCKNYYKELPFGRCLVCLRPTAGVDLCPEHTLPYRRAWCISDRDDILGRIIDDLKFKRVLSAHQTLAELLDERLPDLSAETILVPTPTTARNVRLRGYDHIGAIVKHLAKIRRLQTEQILLRQSSDIQHFAKSAKQRKDQAKNFFRINRSIDPNLNYLIIDDIFTTGATIQAGADCLREAGAENIDVAVIARQRWVG